MNLNLKNQINQQSEGGNILKDAIQVKHVHNQITGVNNTNTNIPNKNQNVIEAFSEIKQRKRPTTSKWSSTLSNMSNRLSNQFNSTFMKNENEKAQTKFNNKVNNVYFNNYIDMQFRSNNNLLRNPTAYQNPQGAQNKFGVNMSNKEESSYYITATKNEKFLNENALYQEKKIQVFLL